jgi:3,4-dihydroxy 2-butanone 4-phosphate synthase/GTP cyclohydrolase II
VSPGHIFPLRSVPGGVLERTGQTEGSVDLARLAGMKPAGVICEIMREDGTMARMPDLEAFAEEHGLQILSIADLISYRLQRETLVERMAGGSYVPGLEGVGGDFRAYVYRSRVGGAEFFALALGEWSEEDAVPVRVHSACIGDVFNSQKCDCGALLRESLRRVDEEGRGVVLYIMPHRIRLAEQFQGHVLHEPRSRAQEEADWEEPLRGFGLGAQVLLDIGVRKIKLLTNNPKRIAGLAGYGLTVVERVPVPIPETHHNVTYLELKRERGEHESPGSDPNGEQSNGDSEDEVSNG